MLAGTSEESKRQRQRVPACAGTTAKCRLVIPAKAGIERRFHFQRFPLMRSNANRAATLFPLSPAGEGAEGTRPIRASL